MPKLPKPTKEDLKRHKQIEKRVKSEDVQLEHPKGRELFDKILRRAKRK